MKGIKIRVRDFFMKNSIQFISYYKVMTHQNARQGHSQQNQNLMQPLGDHCRFQG